MEAAIPRADAEMLERTSARERPTEPNRLGESGVEIRNRVPPLPKPSDLTLFGRELDEQRLDPGSLQLPGTGKASLFPERRLNEVHPPIVAREPDLPSRAAGFCGRSPR